METIKEKKNRLAKVKKEANRIRAKAAKAKAMRMSRAKEKIDTQSLVMACRAMHPEYTQQDIADELDIPTPRVNRALNSTMALEALKRITENEINYLSDMRIKAISLLDAVLCNSDEPISLRVNIAKFLSKNVIEENTEAEPHTLIFETVIAENGALTKNVQKLFEGDYEKNVTPD